MAVPCLACNSVTGGQQWACSTLILGPAPEFLIQHL